MDSTFKTMIFGETGVGKTQWKNRIAHEIFDNNYKPTVGVDFSLFTNKMPNGDFFRFQMWDIAANERFGNMMRVYCKDATVCFLFCDATRISTIKAIHTWLEIFRSHTDVSGKYPCYLIITKMDLLYEDKDKYSENIAFIGAFINTTVHIFQLIYKVSAKTNKIYHSDGTETPLDNLMPEVIENIKTKYINDPNLNIHCKRYDVCFNIVDKVNYYSNTKAPSVDDIESPTIDNIKSPSVDNIKSPSIDNIKSPSVDNIKMPVNNDPQQVISIVNDCFERVRLQLTPKFFYTNVDIHLIFCYKIYDFIISHILKEENASRFVYYYTTHGADKKIIDSLVSMLEKRSLKCETNDTNMTVTW